MSKLRTFVFCILYASFAWVQAQDVRWRYQTGGGVESSPAVSKGVVYVGAGDDGGPDKSVYALNAGTGTLIWNYTTGSYVYSSPAVSNGIVYVGSDDGSLYALSELTGAKLWSYTTGDSVFSSPAVSNGVVYVGSLDGSLYAVTAAPPDHHIFF